jgi:outer membrane lipoprotein-sorting protein
LQLAVGSSPQASRRKGLTSANYRLLLTAYLFVAASCASKPPTLPTGTGVPYPEFRAAYDKATESCRGVKTITASMGMSGKAGSTKLRGRIDAGFAAPDRARLEGVPPFGRKVFILVAQDGKGTLVLPRDERVLRDAPPDQIVEALAGVALGPDALRTAISGCGFGAPPSDGRSYPNGWVAAVSGDTTTYLRPRGEAWEVAAAARGPVTIVYSDYQSGRPTAIRLRSVTDGRVTADITLTLSDVDINTTLEPRVFDIGPDLPERPVPLTLEELRRAGPMGAGT